MNPLTTGLLVVAGVAIAAWLLRRLSGDDGMDRGMLSGRAPGHGDSRRTVPDLESEDEVEDASGEVAAITSDGWMFMPFKSGVQLLAAASPEETAEESATRAVSPSRVAGMLSRGDLIATRVVRGAPGVDPWRLEALGRDRDFLSWSFETDEAARTALDLLERIVVKAPAGPDGEPEPPTPGDFEEARRVKEETAQALAMMPDADEPEAPA